MTARYYGLSGATKVYYGSTLVWSGGSHDYSQDYLTFEIVSGGTIMFQSNRTESSIAKEIQYSINNGSWTEINSSGYTGFTVSTGDVVRFKGANARYGTLDATSPRASFQDSTAVFNMYGNIMSMIYGDNFIGQTVLDSGGYNFIGIFGNVKVVNAENLVIPAETIPDYGLTNFMIESPTLQVAPKQIPATTIGVCGMQGSFARCGQLTNAPEFSVTNVADSGFVQTFVECSSLVHGPSILPIQTMGGGACRNMFGNCTSLTTAPELPCATLSQNAYNRMFLTCPSLNYVKCLATDISATDCVTNWITGVASTGTFVKKAGVTWPLGYSGIPSRWTVIEE